MHKTSLYSELAGVYSLQRPDYALPLVLDSPHSGVHYPDDFDTHCSLDDLQNAEDKYVDSLFDMAPLYGAPLLCAQFPRTYIDVNRSIDDIDEGLLETPWPEAITPTARSAAGIGLIRRLLKPQLPLYNRSLRAEEITHRIETYYKPYHTMLETLLEEAYNYYGQVWHINCHSMPSQNIFQPRRRALSSTLDQNPDFVLGTLDGTSCSEHFTQELYGFLADLGYQVSINDPYKGVELVARYANPEQNRHSIQIEIAKRLYMNETTHEKSQRFDPFKQDIEKLVQFCSGYVESQLVPLAAD